MDDDLPNVSHLMVHSTPEKYRKNNDRHLQFLANLEWRGHCKHDADNEEDPDVKLMSLQTVWDDIIPGFHQWFIKNRFDIFRQSLFISSRKKLKTDGSYYSNDLELNHRLLK